MADEKRTEGVQRLFLGGPLNGRRLVVERETYNYFALKPMPWIYITEPDPFDLTDDRVMYTLRRTPDGLDRVFVAPDYTYDTPEWLAFDTEAWVARLRPKVTGWEHRGPWRWRGRPPEDETSWMTHSWLYLLGDGRGEGYVQQLVADEMAADLIGGDGLIFDHMQREIDYQRLPTCVVPDCDKKAPVVLTAGERGRLAGRTWQRGDEIRLCPAHHYDVLRAQGVYGRDQLADWLKPDAMLDPLDAYDAGSDLLYGDQIAESRARMLRVYRETPADG